MKYYRFLIKTPKKIIDQAENPQPSTSSQPSQQEISTSKISINRGASSGVSNTTVPDNKSDNSGDTGDSDSISNNSDISSHSHEYPAKKRKRYYKQKFAESWLKNETFATWLIRNPNEQNEAFCKLCSQVIAGGITHINRHAASRVHKKKINAAKNAPRVTEFYNKKKEEKLTLQVKTSELKILGFIAEHNLAFSVLDHLPQLILSVCPDSEIAKKIKLGRKKGTRICKDVMKREDIYVLSQQLQTCKFSLIIDETTDISASKSLVMVVRFYNTTAERVCDRFLSLVKIENATASGIFDSISKVFDENKIPRKNLFGFAADNAATMMGHKAGVQQKLLEFNPTLYVFGCSCHTLDLCSSAACAKLPNSVEELTRDIYSYFSHSCKRIDSFKEYQLFTETQPHRILRPSQTRWLSLQLVVDRILEQWAALKLFFTNEALAENIKKAKDILTALNNHTFKLYFSFLSYILDIVNKINLELQSEGFKMHVLLSRITDLYKTILRNFMNHVYINERPLNQFSFHPSNYLPLNDIYVGANCEIIIVENHIPDNELKQFKISCLNFYVELCSEIKKRFKFNDPVLAFAKNLDPKVVTDSPQSIVPIYSMFKLSFPDVNVEQLSTEWRSIATNDVLLKNTDKPVEEFWTIIFKMKNTLLETLMFPNLKIFVAALLSLPHSSAAAERKFSDLNLIKTKNRNKLKISTCDALLHTKSLLSGTKCYDFKPSEHLLSLNINANSLEDEEPDNITF